MNCENIGFISVHFPTAFFVLRLKMTHRNQVSVICLPRYCHIQVCNKGKLEELCNTGEQSARSVRMIPAYIYTPKLLLLLELITLSGRCILCSLGSSA